MPAPGERPLVCEMPKIRERATVRVGKLNKILYICRKRTGSSLCVARRSLWGLFLSEKPGGTHDRWQERARTKVMRE